MKKRLDDLKELYAASFEDSKQEEEPTTEVNGEIEEEELPEAIEAPVGKKQKISSVKATSKAKKATSKKTQLIAKPVAASPTKTRASPTKTRLARQTLSTKCVTCK